MVADGCRGQKNRLPRQKIIIVDDEPPNIKILAEALKEDYDVRQAKTGQKALDICFSDSPPDLVLLDIIMPEMDGYSVCKELQKQEKTKNIPIIFLTSMNAPIDEAKGLAMGAVDYIVKPFNSATVKARVMAHLDLKRHRDDLKLLVEARTMQLTQLNQQLRKEIDEKRKAEDERNRLEKQLYHASKMEALGTMAGGVAHDFNNIIASMMLNTEMAIDDVSADDETHYCLQQVMQGGYRARKLIEQILMFSRNTDTRKEVISLRPIVRDTINMLRSLIPSTIIIQEQISSDTEPVMANPVQIQQLIVNLCTNAAQAIEDKNGVLKISLDTPRPEDIPPIAQLKKKPHVRLTVRDSGKGIPQEIKDRIFDPFFTTKQPGEGTGLGLSVVHGIVTSLKGVITLESKPGEGTSFFIFLPTTIEAAESREFLSETLPQGTETILFVDDETTFVDANKRSLERMGYKVDGFTSSRKALEHFRKNHQHYDLAIIDMTMPDINGVDLAKEVLNISNGFPIILCTGYSPFISSQKAKDLGICEFVMKPFDRREMAKTIRSVLNKMKPEK